MAEPSDSGENYRHLLLHSHTCSHSCPQCAGCLMESVEGEEGREGDEKCEGVRGGREQAQVFGR